jgi:hypothetical protein
VQANGRQDVVREQCAQERQRRKLMQVVDAAQRGRFALVVEQVPQVVQQRRRDQRVAGTFVLGARGRLQRVLDLVDRLARIGAPPFAGKQDTDVGDRESHAGAVAVYQGRE